jgi:hypothetical protein
VKGIQFYLEGPGRELRPVTIVSKEMADIRTAGIPSRSGPAAADTRIEVSTLVDERGNLARQVDCDGFKFKFNGSEIPWSLVVG